VTFLENARASVWAFSFVAHRDKRKRVRRARPSRSSVSRDAGVQRGNHAKGDRPSQIGQAHRSRTSSLKCFPFLHSWGAARSRPPAAGERHAGAVWRTASPLSAHYRIDDIADVGSENVSPTVVAQFAHPTAYRNYLADSQTTRYWLLSVQSFRGATKVSSV
jgi:hypothetical protein